MTRPVPDEQDGRTSHGERSRRLLLDAALEEFAEHGYAGARVAAIATRAGVNKQLITYHFGGKRGLYDELQAQWQRRERDFRSDDPTLPELVVRYLEAASANPQAVRLSARQILDSGALPLPSNAADVADLRARQERGELADDLDPGAVLLAIMGMVTAPTLLPSAAADLLDGDLDRYAEQLARIVAHLSGRRTKHRKR